MLIAASSISVIPLTTTVCYTSNPHSTTNRCTMELVFFIAGEVAVPRHGVPAGLRRCS